MERKTFKQIWKDIKCVLGWHDKYTWWFESWSTLNEKIYITECYNCDYRHEEPTTSFTAGPYIEKEAV